MPNWAYNTLTVRGRESSIKNFKESARENKHIPKDSSGFGGDYDYKTDLSLNKLYPMPAALQGTKSPSDTPNQALISLYGYDNWYDWSIHNWGCKWDVDATLVIDEPKKLIYTFDSPWSPPINWLEKVSADFPALLFKLRFEEEGQSFKGAVWYQAGNMVREHEYIP